jgi:hypothetical protein
MDDQEGTAETPAQRKTVCHGNDIYASTITVCVCGCVLCVSRFELLFRVHLTVAAAGDWCLSLRAADDDIVLKFCDVTMTRTRNV